ncbi:pyridoxamine 5'-phosphate oxidase family protein [Candidatus Lokiarchaeum ossiferum]|uniref:pyridoxamine 5'-phosphate oxidase family protein n=1 Tax=Candidatus Lokiarchaeum ossiferum TaxID=2951803 RepID=UPI00352EE662
MQLEEIMAFLSKSDIIYFASVENCQPRVRVMGLIYSNEKFWVTSKTSRTKINQLKENSSFEFCTVIKQGNSLGTIRARGTANIIDDNDIKSAVSKSISWFDTYWKSSQDPDYTLIELDIHELFVQSPFDKEFYHYSLKEVEKYEDDWPEKLYNSLETVVGADRRSEIIKVKPGFGDKYTLGEIEDWTISAVNSMEQKLSRQETHECISQCAHIMPDSRIKIYRDVYEKHHDVDEVLDYMQTSFLQRLEDRFEMKMEWRNAVMDEKWGEAGYRKNSSIIATKMPANFIAYFEAEGKIEKGKCYCHCGRIRNLIGSSEKNLSPSYCYCGGGFYKSNWERILSQPVEIKLLKSILQGDDVCQFEIKLPENIVKK